MKCKIPEIVTEAQEAARHKRSIAENDIHFKYVDRMILLSLHDHAGFGLTRFIRYNTGAYAIGRKYITRYGEDNKEEAEYAVDSYYALRRDLRDLCGWDAEKELWSDDDLNRYKPDENSARIRRMHENRLGYAKGIGFYVRQQMCMCAIYLCTELGWAGVRLNRVLAPVRDAYLDFLGQFLRCNPAADEDMRKRYADVRKKYNDMGYFEPEYN